MRSRIFSLLLSAAVTSSFVACSDDDIKRPSNNNTSPDGGTTNPDGGAIDPDGGDPSVGKPVEEVTGNITADKTLSADKVWLLRGIVFVKAGATLTIAKGTTIKGDAQTKATLVIQPGAKIQAEGTADEPIVFTSQAAPGFRKAGDWGGVILLGNAPVNVTNGKGSVEGITTGGEYGGTDANDNSGTVRYVRIEYAGVQLSPDNEINGLTLAGVGRGTKIDHVNVRHALDDCFEFFGGTVDAHHLVCAYNQDDAFDWDNGYTGRLQYLVIQQDPDLADETNGFEGDDHPTNFTLTPFSEPTIYNVTMCGKNADLPRQQYAMLLRRGTRAHLFNIVGVGFDAGIDVRDTATTTHLTGNYLELKSSVFFGMKGTGVTQNIAYAETGTGDDKDDDGGFNEAEWFLKPEYNNSTADPKIGDCFNATAPKFGPEVTLAGATPPDDGFFDKTANFKGAFKDAADTWATTGKWVAWGK